MNLIGFAFTKLNVERSYSGAKKTSKINNIDILSIEKEDTPLQMKNSTTYRTTFRYTITYNDKDAKKETKIGGVELEGYVILALNDEESKEITKNWKKKEISPALRGPLFTLLMKKCAPKAIDLEDSVGLPFHVAIVPTGLKFNEKQ